MTLYFLVPPSDCRGRVFCTLFSYPPDETLLPPLEQMEMPCFAHLYYYSPFAPMGQPYQNRQK